jgi:hypothetical protein
LEKVREVRKHELKKFFHRKPQEDIGRGDSGANDCVHKGRRKRTVQSYLISFLSWTVDYSGIGAEFVKALPVILVLLCVTYPWWSFPFWLRLSLLCGEPLCYVIYALWVGQWFILGLISFTVAYLRS